MNILYIASVIRVPHCGGEGSGGSTHAWEVARHLAARGNHVILACRRSPGQPRKEQNRYAPRWWRTPTTLFMPGQRGGGQLRKISPA